MSLADQALTMTSEDGCRDLILVGQASQGDSEFNPQPSESVSEVFPNHGRGVEFNPQTSEAVHKALANPEGDIEFSPQCSESVYRVLANHQKTEDTWELCATFKWLQEWVEIFNNRFELGLTNFTLAVDWLRGKRSGQFRQGFNGLGLASEVTIDRREIERGNQHDILAILLHELLHGWQERHGTPSTGTNNHHNAEFRRRAAECGLQVDEHGHMQLIPGSPFFDVVKCESLNIAPPPVVPKTPRKKAPTKLKKWSCKCEPAINVRVAVSTFYAQCLRCGQVFQKKD